MPGATPEKIAWIAAVLGVTLPPPVAGASPLAAWHDAKATLDAQVAALQGAFRGIDHPLAQDIADRGLAGLTGGIQTGLQAALMDYERAPSADRAARAAAVRAATAALRDFAAGNPALPVLADNPFGVQADIAAVLTDAAERIDALVAA